MKLLNKVVFGLIVFAFLVQIYTPVAEAQSLIEITPDPATNKFKYEYSKNDNSLVEYQSTNSADYDATGRKYINPEATTKSALIGGVITFRLQRILADLVKKMTGIDGPEEGYLAFQLNGVENIFLLVRVRSQNTVGLFTRSNQDGTFAALVPMEEGGNQVVKEVVTNNSNEKELITISLPDNVVQYVVSMNGIIKEGEYLPAATATLHQAGVGAPVGNLMGGTEFIEADITICGKVSGMPAAEGYGLLYESAIQTEGIINYPYLLMQYYLNDKIYVNASFGSTGNKQVVKINSDGTFSVDMKGMPAGTYRLFGEAFVTFDSSRRVISYGNAKFLGLTFPIINFGENTESHKTDIIDLRIDKEGNINDPSYKQPLCNLIFTFAQTVKVDAEETVCDKIKGKWYLPNIYQAICGIVVAASRFADTAFKYAIELMSKSIGVATNNAYTPNITSNSNANSAVVEKVVFGAAQSVQATNAINAATELCKLSRQQNLEPKIETEPCIIKNLSYSDSQNGGKKNTGAGVQIVKNGLQAFMENGNQPNECAAINLIILKTNCEFSGTFGTVNVN